MAFICGFNGQRVLRKYVEKSRKQTRNGLISAGVDDPKEWARNAADVIQSLDEQNFSMDKNDLRLILLFRE